VQDIKRYIDEHYSDPNMSQSMLAETFKLHSSSISRLFKEEYGVKFVDYVNSVRVEQAARLMGQGNSTVQEVAEKVGFVHSTTFISIFKKVTGFTPGTYQKNHPGTEA
jgi:YesN/AraC family two-component response regulator